VTTLDPAARFAALREKREHVVVGLMSGTSADGIDAAVVRLRDSSDGRSFELLSFLNNPYSRAIADRVLSGANATARELTEFDAMLGRLFAAAAADAIAAARLTPSDIDVIGSHGQTIFHQPPRSGQPGATMQLGCPAVIAATLDVPVVADFRARDMALGGQGAPLVPLVDHLLFARRGEARVLLNIGGLANVSATDGELANVVAFDTGPGNALLDALVRAFTNGEQRFDRDGEWSARGTPIESLLADLLAHPFVVQAPPKSADRDTFGESLARRLMAEHASSSPEDLLATAVRFTADSIAGSIERLPAPYTRIDRVIASGGGVRNLVLMRRLRERCRCPVETSADHGLDPDAKEAVAFAVLARETVLGRPSNLPRVTGAARAAVLGSITL
jgi:anhydro-N-acetylmuramic acid kinase